MIDVSKLAENFSGNIGTCSVSHGPSLVPCSSLSKLQLLENTMAHNGLTQVKHVSALLIQCIFNPLQLSKTIMSEEGKKLGLIDAIVSSQELLQVSRQWALGIADRRKPWLRSLHRTDKIGSLSEARDILKVARQQAKKTAPNVPQHQACLDVIEEGVVHGGYSGVLKVFVGLGFSVH